jgi:EAL domain-containing protein (putative c-di-GMP-specific phosphodiesterase class I)
MIAANLRFLVAEDHDFQRSVVVRMLSRIGAERVYEAANGHEALQILGDRDAAVDIIISDLDMPGMDGMEFIRRLGDARVRTSLIVASALDRALIASVATMAEAYGVRLLGFVTKPLTQAELEPLVQLHGSRPSTPEHPMASIVPLAEIEAGLRRGEFEPFFQPKISLAAGQVIGVEALARWRHRERGLLLPSAFIKPLEESGRIDSLTWIMLAKATAFWRSWRENAVDGTVSVNLSIASLGDMRGARRVLGLVRSQGLDPRHVILEVTESAATSDVGRVLESLARLRMNGFGLSIDDYGTGYSSMQQLSRIAFTELKIDRSFVANALRQDAARVILESSIAMAKNLGITSVAEGVDTKESVDLVRQLGCDIAQGYFVAEPMDSSDFMDWARDQHHLGRT